MGCTCIKQKQILVPAKRVQIFAPTDRYRVVLWASSKETIEKISHELPTSLPSPDRKFELAFSYFPITSIDFAAIPRGVDCVIYVIFHWPEEREQVQLILSKFSKVWSKPKFFHTLYNQELNVFAAENDIIVYASFNTIMHNLFNEEKKIFYALKDHFTEWDTEKKGLISVELNNFQSHTEITQQDVLILKEMDTNNDNMVDFYEFVNWYKRGIQGVLPARRKVARWAYNFYVAQRIDPDIFPFPDLPLNVSETEQKFRVVFGEPFERPGLAVALKVGKGGKKDEFLQDASEVLGYHAQNYWIAFLCERDANHVEDFTKIEDGGNFWYGKVLDSGQEIFDRLNDLWITPVDEYFSAQFMLSNSLRTMFNHPEDLSIRDFLLDVESSFWEDIETVLSDIPLPDVRKWISTLLSVREIEVRLEEIDTFLDVLQIDEHDNQSILKKLKEFLDIIFDRVNEFRECVNILDTQSGNMTIYFRHRNFGLIVDLKGFKPLLNLFMNIN